MKKLIYLLPLLFIAAGCNKVDNREYEPLVPYGTFIGLVTHVYTDPVTQDKDIKQINIKLVMATTGFTVTSDDVTIHENSKGEFLGDNTKITFTDSTYPTTAPDKIYLHGEYLYTYNGQSFKMSKQSGNNVYNYELVKFSN